MNLSDVSACGTFRVHDIGEQGEAAIRLKRMGICANRTVDVLHVGDPMIVRVVGVRLGISRRLASHVELAADVDESALANGHQTPS